jgi:hypothetical protein
VPPPPVRAPSWQRPHLLETHLLLRAVRRQGTHAPAAARPPAAVASGLGVGRRGRRGARRQRVREAAAVHAHVVMLAHLVRVHRWPVALASHHPARGPRRGERVRRCGRHEGPRRGGLVTTGRKQALGSVTGRRRPWRGAVAPRGPCGPLPPAHGPALPGPRGGKPTCARRELTPVLGLRWGRPAPEAPSDGFPPKILTEGSAAVGWRRD